MGNNKNLKDINKKCKRIKTSAIIFTAMFILGFALIMSLNDQLFVPSIICVFLGFYGTPITWCYFAHFSYLKGVCHAIEDNKVTDITHLSQIFNKSEFLMQKSIGYLVSHGYINNTILYKETEKTSEPATLTSNKCDGCGAPLKKQTDNEYICNYCGIHYKLK